MLKFNEQKQIESVNGALALRNQINELIDGEILCFAVRSAVLNFIGRKRRKTESGNVSARTAEKLLPLHGKM